MENPSNLYIHANTVGAFDINNPQITFDASDNDSIDRFEVSIDGSPFTIQSSPYTPTLTASPAHEVTIRAYDAFENFTEETLIYPPACLVNGVSLFEVTPVTPFNTSDTTPDYTFYSSDAGMLGVG